MIIDTPRALPALKALWQQAFGDSDAFIDRFFETGFSKDRCRCLYENGDLAAVLYWFDCRWQDKKLAYLYAIATDKMHRHKGFCTALMDYVHDLLKCTGYTGAILVPAEESLFRFYEKLGYRGICPVQLQQVSAGSNPVTLTKIDHPAYSKLRPGFLPQDSVLQEGASLAYLATYADFYQGEDFLLSCSRDGDTLYVQEFLGSVDDIPGILAALGAKTANLRIPGGNTPYAMYRAFPPSTKAPAYFGIPLD